MSYVAIVLQRLPEHAHLSKDLPEIGSRRFKRGSSMKNLGSLTLNAIFVAALLATSASSAIAQTPADNTKVNTRDRAKSAVTADQQKENAADRQLTQKVRRALMQDKALSSYAHNVKIIAQGGQVTLKGPVRTEEEKRTVEAKATEVAGAGHVVSQLSIAPGKTTKR